MIGYRELRQDDKNITFNSIRSLNKYLFTNLILPSPEDYISMAHNCYKKKMQNQDIGDGITNDLYLLSDDHQLLFNKLINVLLINQKIVDDKYIIIDNDKDSYDSLYFIPHTYFYKMKFITDNTQMSHFLKQIYKNMNTRYITVTKSDYISKYNCNESLYEYFDDFLFSGLIEFPPRSKLNDKVYLFSYTGFCETIVFLCNKNDATIRFKNMLCFNMKLIMTYYNNLHQELSLHQEKEKTNIILQKQSNKTKNMQGQINDLLQEVKELTKKVDIVEEYLPSTFNLYIYEFEVIEEFIDLAPKCLKIPLYNIGDKILSFSEELEPPVKFNKLKLINIRYYRIFEYTLFIKQIKCISKILIDLDDDTKNIYYKESNDLTNIINDMVSRYLLIDTNYAEYLSHRSDDDIFLERLNIEAILHNKYGYSLINDVNDFADPKYNKNVKHKLIYNNYNYTDNITPAYKPLR